MEKELDEEGTKKIPQYWLVEKTDHKGKPYLYPKLVLGYKIEEDETEETTLSVNNSPIDDLWETNTMLDTYDEVINGRLMKTRNFHLDIESERFKRHLTLFKESLPKTHKKELLLGLWLKYYQRRFPSVRGKREWEEWCKRNPKRVEKINNLWRSTKPKD